MLIPIRCYSCGKLLANKYNYFQDELLRKKLAMNTIEDPLIIDINIIDIKKSIAGEIMDDLGLVRVCCRKVMMTNINIINEV